MVYRLGYLDGLGRSCCWKDKWEWGYVCCRDIFDEVTKCFYIAFCIHTMNEAQSAFLVRKAIFDQCHEQGCTHVRNAVS